MLVIWKMLRAKFFERLPVEDRFRFNRMYNLTRLIAKHPAYSEMQKQEMVYPLLRYAVLMCRRTLKQR